ncbi:MAG TPA: hypothetical protein VFP84_39720 [Kofleriaceae bacterium]|nr:hypothetical protein [Kofleriaceae bacterium]
MSLFMVDTASLSAVAPGNVTAYLRSRRWAPATAVHGDLAMFRLELDGEAAELDVPLRQTFRDYALRIREVLDNLAAIENRSQQEIYQDLIRTNQDVIRIAVDVPASGRLRLDDAGTLITAAQDLLLAAACAAHSQRVYFRRKPQRAVDYLRTVNLAAPEAGSFVVVLESPLPTALAAPPSFALTEDEPFERSALITLVKAAARAQAAVETAHVQGTLDRFSDEVQAGVNANYCDALASMLEDVPSRGLQLALSWAPSRPVLQTLPSRFAFSKLDGPVLRAAAKFLKERAPISDFELVGQVVRLDAPDPAQGGIVRVAGLVDEAIRQVQVSLGTEDYQRAIEAHQHQRLVTVEGELVKEGRAFRLLHPRLFAVLATA